MKIKTSILQEMITKAIKGASNNKNLPITNLIGIDLFGDRITLTTTDGNNTLYLSYMDKELLSIEPFYTIVNVDTFSKLVAKTTKEYIELENKENYLEFIGNGTYKLDLAINEEGELIQFPTIPEFNIENQKTISLELLKNVIKTSKPSTLKTMEIPMLTGYYLSNKVITTNMQLVTNIDENIIDTPILITSELADLIEVLDGQTVKVEINDKDIIFETDNIVIYGKQLEGVETYPIQAIESLLALQYQNCLKVNKQELLDVLDRMALFVTDYDKNRVFLNIKKEGLEITSQKSNATEIIEIKNTVETEFNCLIDIEMLKSQVQSLTTNIVEIWYGQEKSIQLKEGNTTLVVSLLNKEGE